MVLSLHAAAQHTGTSPSEILQAIMSGQLAATQDVDGTHIIDPDELERVYPGRVNATLPACTEDHEATMVFSLHTAAQRTGISPRRYFSTIMSGQLAATTQVDGTYAIDLAELERVYPARLNATLPACTEDHEATMVFSLHTAAQRTGISPRALLSTIMSGQLAATTQVDGTYAIDLAELERVYPARLNATLPACTEDHEATMVFSLHTAAQRTGISPRALLSTIMSASLPPPRKLMAPTPLTSPSWNGFIRQHR